MKELKISAGLAVAIESAIAGGSIVLTSQNGSTILAEWTGKSEAPRFEELLERLTELLQKAAADIKAVGRIAVSAGPGSFTGIRIGISTALGLAHGIECQLATVNLFDALSSIYLDDMPKIFYLPMGRGKAVLRTFEGTSTDRAHNGPVMIERDEIPNIFSGSRQSHCHLYHDALSGYFREESNTRNIGDNMALAIARYTAYPAFQTSMPVFLSPVVKR